MMSQVVLMRALWCLLFLTDLLEGTPLLKIKNAQGILRIDSSQANDFLSHSRPKRSVEPTKWYRATPDFQSYYRFYNSIGHTEGLYEIDRIRMLYQQMRHLEVEHGADASSYQNALGVLTSTAPPPTTPPAPPTTTTPPPPPPPTTTVDPLADADIIFLCNPKDKLCRPSIVYLPAGGVPVLCDPRYDPACRVKTEEELLAETATQAPPPAAVKAEPAAPPTTPPPPPPPVEVKGMEYDCDPYWDPDCLIDHPPRPAVPAQETTPLEAESEAEATPPIKEEPAAVQPAQEKISSAPLFDPYDWKRDLYDPNAFAEPDADEE